MRFLLRAVSYSFVFLAAACGPGATSPSKPAETPSTDGTATIAEGAAPDLSPVAAPQELFLIGRLKNPAAIMDQSTAWARLPFDWRRELGKAEPGLEQVVHWDAPVDVAAALDPAGRDDVPQPFMVVSLGLRSLQEAVDFARRNGENVRQVRAGVYRVGRGSPNCAIGAAVGVAPARLVCGDRPEDVDALLPYVTRGLPKENLGSSDLRVEVRAEPWRRRYAAELRQAKTLATPFALRKMSLDDARFDRPLADAVHALTDEGLALVEELDNLRIDATLNKSKNSADATISAKFRGSGSWLVQSFVQAQGRATVAPETFFKLPKASTAASYSSPVDAKRSEPIRRNLGELLDGFLAHTKVPKRIRDQAVSLVDDMWLTESGSVYARGDIALPPPEKEPSSSAQERESIRAGVGWHLGAVEEPMKKYKGYLDRVLKLYNDREMRKLVQKEMHVKPNEWPTARVRGGKGLPAGSLVYEIVLPGTMFMDYSTDKPKAGTPLPVVVILVPDGNRTWFGISADEKQLIEHLNTAKKGDSASTLAGREGLARLRGQKAITQGFFSLMTFLGSVQSALRSGFGGSSSPKELEKILNAMPHHGATPMLTSFNVKTGGSPEIRWDLSVPKEVFVDLGALGPAIVAATMGAGMAPPSF
ncbi:MAG: hypothetical protein R3B13_01355 [Polyangiaceae bacterium]